MTEAQAVARRARAERARRRRADEALCARDFLTWGDVRGAHADFCLFVAEGEPPCSRHYDPGPPPEDEYLYEGTGIGALYGLGGERHLWQLAGWTLTRNALDNPPTIEGKA